MQRNPINLYCFGRLLVALILFTALLNKAAAQSPSKSATDALRGIFSGVANPNPAVRFFYDLAAHTVDSTYYNPIVTTDTNSADVFFRLFEDDRYMAYDTNILIKTDSLFNLAWPHIQGDTFPVGITDFKFNLLRPNMLDTNIWFDFDTILNVLSDKPGRPSSPFQSTQNIFAASTLYEEYHYTNPVFMVSPKFIFADPVTGCNVPCPKLDGVLKLDFDDGTGWHVFNADSTSYYRATYSSGGLKLIKVGLFTPFGVMTKYSKSTFRITSDDPEPLPADSVWQMIDGVNAHFYTACQNGTAQKKYVLYLEGIDLTNRRKGPEVYEYMIKNEGLAELRNLGYTFVVVDWVNSYKDIKDHAMKVVDIIDRLKRQDPDLAPLVVIGESMGGLVGRYALRYMETNDYTTDQSRPDIYKMHNTRLFITIDAPHKGANIPMAYQWFYKFIVSGPLPHVANPLSLSIIGNSWNAFLDGKSAKQMLIHHTNSDMFGFFPVSSAHYGPAQAKIDFDNDLAALGNDGYPMYCKKVAMSNGSWRGDKQRKSYDEAYRDANDHFLRFAIEKYLMILGTKVLGAEAAFDMQSAPDGDGDVFNLGGSKYSFSIKLKWWGVKIGFTKNMIVGVKKTSLGSRPIDVAPGSFTIRRGADIDRMLDKMIPSFGEGHIGSAMDPFYLSWSGSRGGIRVAASVGVRDWVRLGVGLDAFSDGTSFCFIPTASSFAYSDFETMDLNENLMFHSVADLLDKTPFDAVITNATHLAPGKASVDPSERVYVGNRNHLFVENSPKHYNTFISCPFPESAYMESSILNREIGDDSLFLENTEGQIPFHIEAYTALYVNRKNPHYNYDGVAPNWDYYDFYSAPFYDTFPAPNNRPPVVISKSNRYNILGGVHTFSANDSVGVDSLNAWDYIANTGHLRPCCNYYSLEKRTIDQPDTQTGLRTKLSLNIYPNPCSSGQSITINYGFEAAGMNTITVYNAIGQRMIVSHNNYPVGNVQCNFKLPVNLSPGIYFLRIENGRDYLNAKFVVTE